MIRLIRFQFQRSIVSKKLVLSFVLLLLIAIAGVVLCEAFYSPLDNSRIGLLSLFNSFTQFFYLVFAFLLVSMFADDIQSGSIILLRYMGYSESAVTTSKLLFSLILFLPSVDVLVLVGALVYSCQDASFILTLITLLDLSVVQVVLTACFFSRLIKRTNIATLVMYGWFICSNILNLFLSGLINQADGNSITTYCVTIASGMGKEQPYWSHVCELANEELFFTAVICNLVWIALLLLLSYAGVIKKRKHVI